MVPKWDGDRVDHTLDSLVSSLPRRVVGSGRSAMELTAADIEAKAQRADELARVGSRIRDLRLERGLTQKELSEAAGLHRVNLNKLEKGRADLGVSRLRRLAGSSPAGWCTTSRDSSLSG